MKIQLLAATAAVMMFATAAAAQGGGQGGGMAAVREACGADIQKFCADKMGDRDARRQCMMENHDKFSDGCKKVLDPMMDRMKSMQGQKPQ